MSDLGNYYIVNENLNTITAQHVILEPLARELGVLADWEFEAGSDGDPIWETPFDELKMETPDQIKSIEGMVRVLNKDVRNLEKVISKKRASD